MQKSATNCMMNTSSSGCGGFIPWLWIAVAFLAIAFGYFAVYMLREKIKSKLMGWLLTVSFVIVLVIAALSFLRSIGVEDSVSNDPLSSAGVSASSLELNERVRNMAPPGDSSSRAVTGEHPFPGVPKSRSQLTFEDDPFIATSKAEQAWLDRNGYPNKEQWAAYINASDLRLREAAELGDKAANGILLHRRLMGGDDSAIDEMLREGALGSGFALDMLASFLASSRGGEDKQIAYAISRVSEMRGNLRLSGARDLIFNNPLSSVERMQAEQEAIEIFNSIYQLQKKLKGPNSSPVDPRPIGG